MLRSSSCYHSDEYLVIKRTVAITGAGADAGARQADGRNKQVIFKNCAPFSDYVTWNLQLNALFLLSYFFD